MPSTFAWLDHSEAQRRQMMEVVGLFREKSTLDELGIGAVRGSPAMPTVCGIAGRNVRVIAGSRHRPRSHVTRIRSLACRCRPGSANARRSLRACWSTATPPRLRCDRTSSYVAGSRRAPRAHA
jgi:hypothetical protein